VDRGDERDGEEPEEEGIGISRTVAARSGRAVTVKEKDDTSTVHYGIGLLS
jgi:hypothetical protein